MKSLLVFFLVAFLVAESSQDAPGYAFSISTNSPATPPNTIWMSVNLLDLKVGVKAAASHDSDLEKGTFFVPSSGPSGDTFRLGFLMELAAFCEITYNTTSNKFTSSTCWLLNLALNNPPSTAGVSSDLTQAYSTYDVTGGTFNVSFSIGSKAGSSCSGIYRPHTITALSTLQPIDHLAGDLNALGTMGLPVSFDYYRKSLTSFGFESLNTNVRPGLTYSFYDSVTTQRYFCGFKIDDNGLYVPPATGEFVCLETSAPDASVTCTATTNGYGISCSSGVGALNGVWTITQELNTVSCS